ncbi:hypothetical protein [Francisella philomiragia]|uniref:hypothetical protein n=1 Tax=Francisella philomiragia TaxID=28110 RepID=UPI001905BBEE|nr:hypothetical protein [Francisella philomiragia]MBK2270201.1 hypothetical protein [Francisella philomiragia]MBK2275865.1 hypothetical protein [Francisella philomiragia]MBK2305078.1 hypothetical protein [Francisella philomiragia]
MTDNKNIEIVVTKTDSEPVGYFEFSSNSIILESGIVLNKNDTLSIHFECYKQNVELQDDYNLNIFATDLFQAVSQLENGWTFETNFICYFKDTKPSLIVSFTKPQEDLNRLGIIEDSDLIAQLFDDVNIVIELLKAKSIYMRKLKKLEITNFLEKLEAIK